jgi:cysteinyl-tRNA synthetase
MGGEDLIFPHHEDEIAQSEGACLQAPGQRFVKYWLHGAHLLVEGKKMSKSLGNFFTLGDLLAKGFSGREIRYLLLTAHYRESFNFTIEGLQGARTALARLDEALAKLREIAGPISSPADLALVNKVAMALDDDLNISRAWGDVFEWIRETNRLLAAGALTPGQASSRLAAWDKVNAVLGIQPAKATATTGDGADSNAIPAEITSLLDQRQEARKSKDFKRSDAIRDELKAKGWVIEDTPKGPRLKRI